METESPDLGMRLEEYLVEYFFNGVRDYASFIKGLESRVGELRPVIKFTSVAPYSIVFF